jgi:hypothetical protein
MSDVAVVVFGGIVFGMFFGMFCITVLILFAGIYYMHCNSGVSFAGINGILALLGKFLAFIETKKSLKGKNAKSRKTRESKGIVKNEKPVKTKGLVHVPLHNIENNVENNVENNAGNNAGNNFSQESNILVPSDFVDFNDCEKEFVWKVLDPLNNGELFCLPYENADRKKILIFLNKILGSVNLIVHDNYITVNITENTTEFLQMNDDEKNFIRNALLNFGKISNFSFAHYPDANKQKVRDFLLKVIDIVELHSQVLYFGCGEVKN